MCRELLGFKAIKADVSYPGPGEKDATMHSRSFQAKKACTNCADGVRGAIYYRCGGAAWSTRGMGSSEGGYAAPMLGKASS